MSNTPKNEDSAIYIEALEEDADFSAISFNSVDEIEKSIVDSPFRAIYQTNNFLLPQIKDIVDESRTVNLRPEYQRRSRWSNKQKSLLIESFILNIPVPPVFLFEGDYARYEVMDGQQRLMAVREFVSNQFKLSSLTILTPLNGRTYSSLPPRTRRTLDRASLSAIVLLKESKSALLDSTSRRVLELRKFVFERLNTGGKPLNAQELRNAVYSGSFNNLIVELARSDNFTDAWGIPRYSESYNEGDYEQPERKANRLYSTMNDVQIVLRFFALRNNSEIKGSMRSILDRCMERHLNDSEKEIQDLKSDYLARLEAAMIIFDGKPFNIPGRGPSEGVYDAVMAAIDRLWDRKVQLLNNRESIAAATRNLLEDQKELPKYTGRANTANDVRARMDAMTALFGKSIHG